MISALITIALCGVIQTVIFAFNSYKLNRRQINEEVLHSNWRTARSEAQEWRELYTNAISKEERKVTT